MKTKLKDVPNVFLFSQKNLDKVFWSLLDKHHRLPAFIDISERIGDHRTFWSIFSRVWLDTECVYLHQHKLPGMLRIVDLTYSKSEQHTHYANDDELALWKWLLRKDRQIKIFRGAGPINEIGWSWTLSKDTAIWFANRCPHEGQPLLVEAYVHPKNIVMLLTRRGEKEVVVNPKHIRVTATQALPKKNLKPEDIIYQQVQAGVGPIRDFEQSDVYLRQLIWCHLGNKKDGDKIYKEDLSTVRTAFNHQKALLNEMGIHMRDEHYNKLLRIVDEMEKEMRE